MRPPKEAGYGVNTVSFYGELEQMEYLLEFIERKLQDVGIEVEFIDVEQHPAGETEAKLRFSILYQGHEY